MIVYALLLILCAVAGVSILAQLPPHPSRSLVNLPADTNKNVTLKWDGSTATNWLCDSVSWGGVAGQYTNAIYAGKSNTVTLSLLSKAQYFFAVNRWSTDLQETRSVEFSRFPLERQRIIVLTDRWEASERGTGTWSTVYEMPSIRLTNAYDNPMFRGKLEIKYE